MEIDVDRALEVHANHAPEAPKCWRCGVPLPLGSLCEDCKDELEGRVSERQRYQQEFEEWEREQYEKNLGS